MIRKTGGAGGDVEWDHPPQDPWETNQRPLSPTSRWLALGGKHPKGPQASSGQDGKAATASRKRTAVWPEAATLAPLEGSAVPPISPNRPRGVSSRETNQPGVRWQTQPYTQAHDTHAHTTYTHIHNTHSYIYKYTHTQHKLFTTHTHTHTYQYLPIHTQTRKSG